MTQAFPQLPPPPGRALVEARGGVPAFPPQSGRELVKYEPLVDSRAILQALYRNRYLILAVMAACLAIGVIYTATAPKIYRSTSKIMIGPEPESPLGTTNGPRDATTPQDIGRTLQTQVDMLTTRDMAREVLRRLESRGGAPAQVAAASTPEQLRGSLTVDLPRNSRIVAVNYDDTNPHVAALMANSYAEALIERNLQTRFNATAYARDFLQKQLTLAKGRLEFSERALNAYGRAAGLLDTSAGGTAQGTTSLTTSNLVQLNSVYAQAQANRIQAQQRWQQAQSTPVMSLPEVLTNSAIQQLNQQKAEAQAKLQENRQRYQEAHPLVQQALANIAELDRQIARMANSVKDSIRDQYQVAARQESALAGSVGQLKGATFAEQDRSVRYNILKREVDTNRELYDGLLQRFKQISAEAGVTNNNIAVVDAAYATATPVSPNAVKNISLAFAGGGILAFLLVFMRERFDGRVSEPDMVDRQVAIPLLSVIPKVPNGSDVMDALLDPNSPLAEACHSLRTAVELGCDGGSPRSILFTSSRAKEGKSTTALGLAYVLGQAGKRILLIDGDLRKPSLHLHHNGRNDYGFADVLAGKMKLSDAVQQSDIFGIDMLTAGPRVKSPAALLDTDRLSAVVGDGLQQYDYVIIDGPPTLGLADSARLAVAVEGTLFVVKSAGVTTEEARFALSRLRAQQSNVVGAVLTMFEARRSLTSYYNYGYAEPVS